MTNLLSKLMAALGLVGVVLSMSACSTAAVGASAVGAVAEAVAGNSYSKESRRRAEMQSDLQSYEEAQTPQHVENEVAYLNVVEQMQKQGLWFASLAHIDALETRWAVSERSRLLRADALRQTGQKESSSVLYRQLLRSPSAARALHGLGLIAAADGQFDAAVSQMQAAQKIAPTDALLLNDLGYALLHTGRGVDAGMPLKQAAQLLPQNNRIQSNLALYLALFGSASEALAWMNQSGMGAEQRMRVLEQARTLSATAEGVASSRPIQVLGAAPQAAVVEVGRSPLIFEKQLTSTAAAL